MEYSDCLTFDYDMNSDFIIIQSCLRDEKHNEFIQNSENITLLDDHLTFNLGDSFESYEALQARLESHTRHSNVHYWMRDTRTVAGARMKTTRKIEPRLKYYNVKYACVYGGNKHFSRSKGLRNTSTLKLNCPAHVTLRANRAGERLDVVSVCNHHNHEVSERATRSLRQARRLTRHDKGEVLELLGMGVRKQRVLEFVAWRSGKQLRYKDVVNLGAVARRATPPGPERRAQLRDLLRKFESESGKSPDHTEDGDFSSETRKRRRKTVKNKPRITKTIKPAVQSDRPPAPEDSPERTPQVPLENVDEFSVADDLLDRQTEEVQVECEENPNNIQNSKIMEYLYRTDCEGEPVFTILNTDSELVTIEKQKVDFILNSDSIEKESVETEHTNADAEVEVMSKSKFKIKEQFALNENYVLEFDNAVAITQEIANLESNEHWEFDSSNVLTILNEDDGMIPFCTDTDSEQYLNHVIIKDADAITCEDQLPEGEDVSNLSGENACADVEVISPEKMHILSKDEVVLEESWIDEDDAVANDDESRSSLEAANEVIACRSCEKIKLNINEELNALRAEKDNLIMETEKLKKEKDDLRIEIAQMKKNHDLKTNSPVPFGVKSMKIRNKIYLVKI